LQHVAFEFGTLDELLGSYARLKALGIVPQFSVDEGPQTGFLRKLRQYYYSRSRGSSYYPQIDGTRTELPPVGAAEGQLNGTAR
jgi:hypothetical protein